MNRATRCLCPSIRQGITVPSLHSSPSLRKEGADSQLIIYPPEKKRPSAPIRIKKSNKYLQKMLHPSCMYPSWAGDKETMISSQENRTGKNLNGPNSTVHVCFCCWAVNRLAFIKQYFTSKITAPWHLALRFKNKQLRSQHKSLPL